MKSVISQGYTPYTGYRSPRIVRFWPIFRSELAALWRLKRVRIPFYLCCFIAFIFVGIPLLFQFMHDIIGGGVIEQNELLTKILDFKDIYKKFQSGSLLILFYFCAVVGGGLISNDLRTNAFPLYFSKPLGWSLYLLGKITVIGFSIFMITYFPGLCIFVLRILLSNTPQEVFLNEYPHLLYMLGYSFILLMFLAPLILAFSSLTPNYNLALISFILFLMISMGISNFFIREDPDGVGKNAEAFNLPRCLRNVGESFYPKVDPGFGINLSRLGLAKKVEDERWIYAHLGFWFVLSLAVLFFRLRRLEVKE